MSCGRASSTERKLPWGSTLRGTGCHVLGGGLTPLESSWPPTLSIRTMVWRHKTECLGASVCPRQSTNLFMVLQPCCLSHLSQAPIRTTLTRT